MPSKSVLPEPAPAEDDALLSEEEALSSGNGRLAVIVGGILALAIVGYSFLIFLPNTGERRVATMVPSVTLGEANVTVTGTRIVKDTAKVAPAPEEETVEVADWPTDNEKAPPKPVLRPEAEASLAPRTTEPVALVGEPAAEEEPAGASAGASASAEAPAEAPANIVLSGRILDENGLPLAGATVLVKGSRKGTGADANGYYTLEVPAGENALVYGYGGYQDQEVRTRGDQPINVTLLPTAGSKRRRK